MRELNLLQSRYLQIFVTLLASVMYVVALGLCFWVPSLWLSAHLAQYIETILSGTYGSWYIVRFSIIIAVSVWLFVVSSVIIMGLILRLTTFRIKPGRYRIGSLTSMRWMFASGLYGIASHFVLPLVRNTFFLIWFYRLIGAKIGRNVQLNSYSLPDAYFLRVGDNVAIGAFEGINVTELAAKHGITKSAVSPAVRKLIDLLTRRAARVRALEEEHQRR
jgi:hypothetical protein